jgi:cellulose synthase operon protein YhjQ
MPLVCFASPKGGVGKTTLAANVAGALARAGHRVVAVDLDPQNSLRLHFGVALGDRAGFACALPERPDWRRAARDTEVGIALLAHGPTDLGSAIALSAAIAQHPEILTTPLLEMTAQPDVYVVVDTAPGATPQLAAVLPITDLLVTVLLVDVTSISLIPAIESGAAYGWTDGDGGVPAFATGFVLNQFDPRSRLAPIIAAGAARHLGRRLLGTIYRDENVAEAVAAQKLVADYAVASKAAYDMAALANVVSARLAPPFTEHGPAIPRRRAGA